VTGLSRSAADLGTHHVVDVTSPRLAEVLSEVGPVDLCVYAAGVGDLDDLPAQTRALEVNLLGAARTLDVVVPGMLAAGGGHIIVCRASPTG
jgi:NADP-dependent 3-hydroxy acid dehydrogenase YdfG